MTTESFEGNRTALVTGASSGIGAELTREIANDGFDIILTARREDRLTEIGEELEKQYEVTATVISKDLADPDAPRELFEEIRDTGHHVHTLVNNAGFPVYGRFDETPLEEELAMMQVNMVALTHLTKLFVRPMIEHGEGVILNNASIAAYVPLPRVAIYAATKAYVLSFSEAIAHELAPEGIQVTTLCPAGVDTEFWEKDDIDEANIEPDSTKEPATIAQAAWDGVKSGDRFVRPGMKAKMVPLLPRVLPQTAVTSFGARTTKRPPE